MEGGKQINITPLAPVPVLSFPQQYGRRHCPDTRRFPSSRARFSSTAVLLLSFLPFSPVSSSNLLKVETPVDPRSPSFHARAPLWHITFRFIRRGGSERTSFSPYRR